MKWKMLTTFIVSMCAAIVLPGGLEAAKRTMKSRNDSAASDVVLREELTGAIDRRAKLEPLLARQPDLAIARWQSGFIREGKEWRSFDAAPRGEKLQPYRARRAEAPATAEGQLALADWCRKQGLSEQEWAHLNAALALAPDRNQPEVRKRLGHRQFAGTWLTREQLSDIREENGRAQDSVKKWESRLKRIAQRLSGSRAQREAAQAELKQITEPSAVGALEYVLAGRDEISALAAVECLARIEGPSASLALARQSVFSKWPTVREAATRSVASRHPESFAPPLIALLAAPVKTGFRMTQERIGGPLLYNYVLARETDDQFQVVMLRTVNFSADDALDGSLAVAGPALTFASERGQNDALRAIESRIDLQEAAITRWNERTQELNGRISSVLAAVSGRKASSGPADWWSWWSDYCDTEQPPSKHVVVIDETEFEGNPLPPVINQPMIGTTAPATPRAECFAAGTPVWTESGLVVIEKLQIGDRVLAKDIETGELAYKPVLNTTVRPPRTLTTLRFAGETIICTGGHRLWASGEGWVKARDLAPQSILHTITGSTPVAMARQGKSAETFNLVVADFHTYFVGTIGLLSQDVLLPRSTSKVVPGLEKSRSEAHQGTN